MGGSADGPTRRSVARFAVLILAALAVAGTSARPTRSPTLQSSTEGAIELTAAHPMASVIVSVTADAALLADPTNQTSILVSRTPTADDAFDRPAAIMVIEALDGDRTPTVGASPSVREWLRDACQRTGDCVRRYRVTAILADPADGTTTVGWRAVAETRLGTDESPGPVPSGADLTIESAAQVAADNQSAAATARSPDLRLDPAHPRFVQTVTLVQPPRAGQNLAGLLRTQVRNDQTQSYRNLARIRIETADGVPLEQTGQVSDLVALPDCSDPGGCRTSLRVVGDWLGGGPDEGATVGWQLATSLYRLEGPPADPIEGLSLEVGEPIELAPQAIEGGSGSEVIGGEKIRNETIDVRFDGDAIDGSKNGAGVYLQATLDASTVSRSGSTKQVLFAIGTPVASAPGRRAVAGGVRADPGLVPWQRVHGRDPDARLGVRDAGGRRDGDVAPEQRAGRGPRHHGRSERGCRLPGDGPSDALGTPSTKRRAMLPHSVHSGC